MRDAAGCKSEEVAHPNGRGVEQAGTGQLRIMFMQVTTPPALGSRVSASKAGASETETEKTQNDQK